jgi:hypothetical protein
MKWLVSLVVVPMALLLLAGGCGGEEEEAAAPTPVPSATGAADAQTTPGTGAAATPTSASAATTTTPGASGQTAVAEAPTQQATNPTAEATPNVIPEVDPILQVDQVIAAVNNVDGSFDPGLWEVQRSAILDGEYPTDRGSPGLYDVRAAMQAGDWALAKQRMTSSYPPLQSLWVNISDVLPTQGWEDEPSISAVTDPDNEIFSYDPQRQLIGGRTQLPLNRLEPIKQFLILYYNLPQ